MPLLELPTPWDGNTVDIRVGGWLHSEMVHHYQSPIQLITGPISNFGDRDHRADH